MPKANSVASSPDARSMPCQYRFRTHSRSTGTLRRNQSCKQCRKRKSKCDAGRPCKACLRAHAVVVANLVKKGLPLDSVHPDCIYDGDSGSEHSSPSQPTSSPVQLSPEPQEFQQSAPTQPDPLPQHAEYDLPLFAPTCHTDLLGLSLDLDTYPVAITPTSASSPQTSPYYPDISSPQSYCYQLPQMPQGYLSPHPSPDLLESDLAQLSYWMYQGPQTASAYAQVSDCDVSRAMWNRQM
ncbi:hypothetical protein FS749_000991 [Ceratobasidium sp. UAMH 11750]|nr:hypothetical protein FS749_000991 [Ceratobasidium sp. UAMH 11750]